MKSKSKEKIKNSDPIAIKTLLVARGITQTEIARRLNVSTSWVGDVINGRKKTKSVQNGIAKILRVKASQIFFVAARPYHRETNDDHGESR